jgi:mannose-6-phosphate isomerase
MKIDAGKVYQLKGVTQNYAWGGFEYIPQLLGIENAEQKRFAEYWMGAHASAPSQIKDDEVAIGDLKTILAEQPELLGQKVLQNFSELPYLFKILDVKEMLSIQVHPTKAEAEKGFADEEARGIAINAPNRNYKDNNHKPEVAIALSDFWLLHGFKPVAELQQTLESIPEFKSLISIFNKGDYKALYSHVMEMPQQQVDELLSPLVKKELQNKDKHSNQEPGFWVAEYYAKVSDAFGVSDTLQNIDRGIFSIYFFNIVHLKEGQGIFQGAGVPHAYLQGQNAELMANSDNVLRAGLTPKHIDVAELMKHTMFEAVQPNILTGASNETETIYYCPVDDFIISKVEIDGKAYVSQSSSPEIFICLQGSAEIQAANKRSVKKGEAFIVFANTSYQIQPKEKTVLYKAYVPV